MGASEWQYTVDYQQDVGAALRQLRQEVYDRGEYYREPADSDLDMTEEEFRARLDPRYDGDGLNEAIVEDWLEHRSTRTLCLTRSRTPVHTRSST